MKEELIRKSDVLDLLNDLTNDFGDNYELYSTLFDSVDEMSPVKIDTEWIPFTRREPTEEEQDENPDICYYLDGNLPEDGEEVLVSDGLSEWIDVFDVDEASLEWHGEIENGMAWMSLPKPYEGETE